MSNPRVCTLISRSLSLALAAASANACTGQLPGSFRLKQQEETFESSQQVNTKLDMLWVIDSSGSMLASQDALRAGFRAFAAKYMQPTWDIRVAVITTDTYLANPAYADYLDSYSVSPSNTFTSFYIRNLPRNGVPGRTGFVNPDYNPNLFNLNPASPTYGRHVNGIRMRELRPTYGSDWALLKPGMHDGQQTILCTDYITNFIATSSVPRCYIRDTGNVGPERCASPGMGEDWSSQCVNTTMNNTARSGRSIIETIPPVGTSPDAAWAAKLEQDFLVNLSVGIVGSGYEKGFGSLTQLLDDNERAGNPYRFFRPDALRVVVMVGDEDDQTTRLPSPVPVNYSPANDYLSSCTKTIDGQSFTLPICPDPARLVPVADVKQRLDEFFRALDGKAADGNPNYFVVSLVAPDAATVTSLRAARSSPEIDRADRFIQLGTLVAADAANLAGSGSMVLNLASTDYTPMLDAIGNAVVSKKAVFELNRAPTGEEAMIVWIVHGDGSRTEIPAEKYEVVGKILTITDLSIVLNLAATDRITINYQPKSVR